MDRSNYRNWPNLFGIILATSLLLSARGGLSQEFATSAPTSESLAAAASTNSDSVTQAVTSSASQEFPRLENPRMLLSPVASWVIKEGEFEWLFGLAKLGLIVAAVFWWLHCMHISSSDLAAQGMEARDGRQSKLWTLRLFGSGLLGIGIAMILPAYAWAAAILIAAMVIPYEIFVSWHNRQLGEAAPQLGILPMLPQLDSQSPVFEPYLPAATGEGAPESPRTIRIVGKSSLRGGGMAASETVESSPAFQFVLSIIERAVVSSATDLHINSRSNRVEVKQRVDGTLEPLQELPLDAGLAVINVLKVLSELSIADRRRSQDGSFLVDVDNRRLSFRVSSQGTQSGEKLSIRILDPAKSFTSLASLGMPLPIVERLTSQLEQRHGLVLFVGATGAGKSTTGCAALQTIDTSEKNVVSIEDPIEYQIPSIDQIEVNYRAGQTFQSALRSVLRLDADVIFIGEIRDSETAKIAIQAALTGQLVLATMHAADSVGAFQRLSDLTGDPTGVAATVRAVIAQALVRKLCPECRTEYAADESTATTIGTSASASLYRSSTNLVLHCPVCDGRRFMRRTAIYELTEVNPEIRELVRSQGSLAQIADAAQRAGMVPLREHALQLVREGIISINEMKRVLGE
ncbi:MAG: GspE/PulE family protein [bacterium]|nr:GspE/PulE family protein [bacterium]